MVEWMKKRSNRTFMELKYSGLWKLADKFESSNRTFMELKYE